MILNNKFNLYLVPPNLGKRPSRLFRLLCVGSAGTGAELVRTPIGFPVCCRSVVCCAHLSTDSKKMIVTYMTYIDILWHIVLMKWTLSAHYNQTRQILGQLFEDLNGSSRCSTPLVHARLHHEDRGDSQWRSWLPYLWGDFWRSSWKAGLGTDFQGDLVHVFIWSFCHILPQNLEKRWKVRGSLHVARPPVVLWYPEVALAGVPSYAALSSRSPVEACWSHLCPGDG